MCEKNKKPLETAELNDDELEQVAGGTQEQWICAQGHTFGLWLAACPVCNLPPASSTSAPKPYSELLRPIDVSR